MTALTRSQAASSYRLFGLVIASELPLPELPPCNDRVAPDISITIGTMDEAPSGQSPSSPADRFVHRVPNVAAYAISGGSRIVIEPHDSAHESHLRLFLLGTALGIALHQRGVLPLHANGVEICGQAILFMGSSGAGKSTLASWFVRRGHRLLADDVCAMRKVEAGVTVLPGIPRLRLWDDALAEQGRALHGLDLSYAGDPDYRKYDVPIEPAGRVAEGLPLGAIYILGRDSDAEISPIEGLEAVSELFAHTYRGEFLAKVGDRARHMRLCAQLAAQIPMFRANRAWGHDRMDSGNELLLRHARSILVGKCGETVD